MFKTHAYRLFILRIGDCSLYVSALQIMQSYWHLYNVAIFIKIHMLVHTGMFLKIPMMVHSRDYDHYIPG